MCKHDVIFTDGISQTLCTLTHRLHLMCWTHSGYSVVTAESNKRKQLTAQQKDLEGFDNKRVVNYYFRFGLPD